MEDKKKVGLDFMKQLEQAGNKLLGKLNENGGATDFTSFLYNVKDLFGAEQIQTFKVENHEDIAVYTSGVYLSGVYFFLSDREVNKEISESYKKENKPKGISTPTTNSDLEERIGVQKEKLKGVYKEKSLIYAGSAEDKINTRIKGHIDAYKKTSDTTFALKLNRMLSKEMCEQFVLVFILNENQVDDNDYGATFARKNLIREIESFAHKKFKPLVGRR